MDINEVFQRYRQNDTADIISEYLVTKNDITVIITNTSP